MGVDVQRDLGAVRGQFGKSWDGDVHFVADAGRFDHNLIGMLGQQFSAEMGNHALGIVDAKTFNTGVHRVGH